MKTARKALMLILCAALLVSATVMGTLAYLTSETGVVTNTFTVGKVAITLDEVKVDAYGVPDKDGARVTANTYKMIGNQSYTKDPTVHVDAASEKCWLFVKVVNPLSTIEAKYAYAEDETGTIAEQMTANGWRQLIVDSKNIENVYYHNGIVDAGANKVVFNGFKIDGEKLKNNAKIGNVTIDAYAIQAEGFSSAAEAWKANAATWTDPTT